MRDYKKYAQDLRRIAQFQNCFECYEGERTEGSCSSYCTLNKAADAIEELLAEVKHWELEAAANETDRNYLIDENRKLVNSLMNFRVPTWISVEDELPEEWREVLAYMPIHSDEKNPHMILICWYIGYGKWRETEYGEIVEIPVTHWMHLPAPPTEEDEK